MTTVVVSSKQVVLCYPNRRKTKIPTITRLERPDTVISKITTLGFPRFVNDVIEPEIRISESEIRVFKIRFRMKTRILIIHVQRGPVRFPTCGILTWGHGGFQARPLECLLALQPQGGGQWLQVEFSTRKNALVLP